MFWVFCAFVGTLILLCVWMLLNVDSAPDQAAPYPGPAYPGQPYQNHPYQGQQYPGQPYWSTSNTASPSDVAQPAAAAPGMPSHPAPQP